MDPVLRFNVIKAAVAWERAFHQYRLPNQLPSMETQENDLIKAVQEYNNSLLAEDLTEP